VRERRLTDICEPKGVRPDWWRTALAILATTCVLVSWATTLWIGADVWELRLRSGVVDAVHAVIALLCGAGPIIVTLIAMRRSGRYMAPMLALITPVVAWLIYCCLLIVVAGVNRGWSF